MSEYFVHNHTEEIQSHALIIQDNLKAMQELAKQVVNDNDYVVESVDQQLDSICKSVEEKKKHLKNKLNSKEIVSKLYSVKQQIQEKKKSIKNLENNLKNLNEQYENFKLEQDKVHRNNKATLNALQKGIKHFKQVFQYTIDTEQLDDPSKYCVVINFATSKVDCSYPIRFIFNRGNDCLLEFDASTLLNKEEHELLCNCYEDRQNTIALLCTLRDIVLSKQNL